MYILLEFHPFIVEKILKKIKDPVDYRETLRSITRVNRYTYNNHRPLVYKQLTFNSIVFYQQYKEIEYDSTMKYLDFSNAYRFEKVKIDNDEQCILYAKLFPTHTAPVAQKRRKLDIEYKQANKENIPRLDLFQTYHCCWKNVKCLILYGKYDVFLDFKQLFSNLEKFVCHGKLKQTISAADLPRQLKYCNISLYNASNSIDMQLLPQTLEYLTIYGKFTRLIHMDAFPPNLKELNLYCKSSKPSLGDISASLPRNLQVFHTREIFQRPIKLDQLPRTLTYLSINWSKKYGVFQSNLLPPNLTDLQVGGNLNQEIFSFGGLPRSLMRLQLGRRVSIDYLDVRDSPPQLQSLIINHAMIRQPIDFEMLPHSLLVISFPIYYDFHIDITVLPPLVERIYLPREYGSQREILEQQKPLIEIHFY